MAGIVYGLIIGLIPAAGATTGLITLFGFMPYFVGDPYLGVIFCVAVVASSTTGDSFSGVLLGIPGANSAAATMVDGFPMAKNGEATRALSVSYTHLRAHETERNLVCRLLLEKNLFLMIRRPPRSTRSVSSAASDVYKRQFRGRALRPGRHFDVRDRKPRLRPPRNPLPALSGNRLGRSHRWGIRYRGGRARRRGPEGRQPQELSLIHISEPTRPREISYAVFCLKKIFF